MGKIELKPCPFCGVKKTWIRRKIGMYYVSCESCGSSTGYWFTKEQAIEAWNTRSCRECYADEQTHSDCKYSVNRGWRERTCHFTRSGADYMATMTCSACGEVYGLYETDADEWNFCPGCGCKVVS